MDRQTWFTEYTLKTSSLVHFLHFTREKLECKRSRDGWQKRRGVDANRKKLRMKQKQVGEQHDIQTTLPQCRSEAEGDGKLGRDQ